MVQVIFEVIGQEMECDQCVFVMGEDIGKYGGIFSVIIGLFDCFGLDCIMDMLILEMVFIGVVFGVVVEGLCFIVELMFVDFFGVCFDQIYNYLVKNIYMFGGCVVLFVVIMIGIGGGYNDVVQYL